MRSKISIKPSKPVLAPRRTLDLSGTNPLTTFLDADEKQKLLSAGI